MNPLWPVVALLALFNLIELVALLCLVIPAYENEGEKRESCPGISARNYPGR